MSVFYDLNKTPRNILNQAIVKAIVSESNGALFDPSDLSTLYQDAAGTIPVTAVEQPVGLWLDKSQGLEFGPELVTNGDFSSGTAGWYTSPASPPPTLATVSGELYVTNNAAGSAAGAASNIATNTGKFYTVTANIRNVSAVDVRVRVINGTILGDVIAESQIVTSSLASKITITFKARETTSVIYLRSNNFGVGVFDNISVREIKGNHATQSITASRPTLSARYNLLTKTEDFADEVWTKANLTNPTYPPVVTPDAAIGPDGITYADLVTPANIAGSSFIEVYQNSTIISGTKYHQYYCVKPNGWRYLQSAANASVFGPGHVNFDLVTGTVTANTPGTGGVSGDITPLANGWFLLHVSATAIANGTSHLSINFIDSATARRGQVATGNGVDGVYVTRGDFRAAAEQNSYQRVNTSTDYDTDERYFKKYLRFDGVDDYLNLPYMGLYAGGACSAVSSSCLNSKSTQSLLLSEANNVNATPLYYFHRHLQTSGYVNFLIRSDTSVEICNLSDPNPVNVGDVVTRSSVDSGTSIKQWDNSADYDVVNYTRQGAVTLNNTTLGALIYTATSSYFNGNLYGLIITKSALTDSQRVACERFESRKSGVLM